MPFLLFLSKAWWRFFFCVLIWHIKFFAPHHTKRTPTLIAAIYSNCFNFYFTLICNFYALTFFLFIKFTREKRARTFPRNFINDSTGKKIGNFEATFYSSDWWEVIFFAFASFFDLPKTLDFIEMVIYIGQHYYFHHQQTNNRKQKSLKSLSPSMT